MQVVDVLCDEREPATPFRKTLLQPRERPMRGVRLGADEVAPARVVEGEHLNWIAREGFGRREPHRVEAGPYAFSFRVAERA